MTDQQKKLFEELLWDSLKHDTKNKDRRRTGWGSKTITGLIASIETIINEY